MRAREFIVEDNESRTEEFHGVNMKIRDDGYEVVASALDDWDREMGSVVFNKGDGNELDPQDLLVIDKFRGQGIAKVMYDYVKSKGYEIHKSPDVTKIADQGKESGEYFWQKNRGEECVWEGVPQPGPSSGAPKQFGSDAKIQTRQMTVKDIISSVPGVPYYNNVVDDWDAKDYSWGVTEKVIEYATYLKDHPESLAKLPPAIVLNGKFEDGAHRVSAIWLLQQRMDPKNPLWKNAKLNVQFVKQGVAEVQSSKPTMGINVRSDGDIDYASLIIDGQKKYESRKTDSLRPYVGKTVGIVRTGAGPAVAIGQVTIGEPIIVDQKKFNSLRKQHLVPQGSKFDIDVDGTKYLYPMIDPVRWDNEKLIKHKGIISRKIEEDDKSKDPIVNAVIDFYKHVGKIHKDPIDDYVSTAKEMLGHVSDPTLKSKLLDIFKQAKQNPYIQGGVVTTIGALLAGGVLSSAQKMGLSPSQTNLALQAILNTVIPTVVSRINGKSWSDTIKYTLASAGIGTGIAGMMDEARGLAPAKPYDDLMANMGYFMSLNTVKIQQDAVDSAAQQELANMQQQFRKPILNGMSFFDVNRDVKLSKNPKVAPILLKYVYDMIGYIEPRLKTYIKPEQQGKYLDRLNQIKDDYRNAVQQVS